MVKYLNNNLDKVGSRDGGSVYKLVRGEVSVGVGGSIGWYVDIGVGSEVDISDEIKFEIDDEYKLGSSNYSSDGFNDGKPWFCC